MVRQKNQALVYARRSTEKQEISLPAQIERAIRTAQQHGVALDATVADLQHMQAHKLHSFKAIRLDDGVTGANMS
jgi:predicted site-specific integrase-resolvase